MLEKRSKDNSAKRPDIAVFCKEGSAIIIEFKAPGVDLDDHTNDLLEYAHLLAAKSKGRLKKFYGYLIGTQLNDLRMGNYKRFPNKAGWFGTVGIMDPETQAPLGELYTEVLFYSDIMTRAGNRLDIYRKRLGINFAA